MPPPCVVPGCKSNYKNGPKHKTYFFPSDEDRCQKWIQAIHRKNYKPTKYSKVCELHFKDTDFITSTKATDERTGKVIEVALKIRRLHENAVPSQFPNLPSYLSSNKTRRDSPECKKRKMENDSLNKAIAASLDAKKKYDESRTFSTLKDLQERINFIDQEYWTVIDCKSHIMFLDITADPVPKVKKSLVIKENLEVMCYNDGLKLGKISKFSFPCFINNINEFNEVLNELKKIEENCTENQTSIILSVIDALNSLENSDDIKGNVLKFIIEQITLLLSNKYAYRYSSNILIFSTLLYTISPQAYRFLRNSNVIILPHPNTVKRLCSSYNLDPHSEQINPNFLNYIKRKYLMLDDKDKLLILMLDEIHLKQLMDYKGGNIVGVSFNSDDCASSAHVFMIKSVLTKYKDVVHVLPVKTLSGEELHLYLNKVIIGLENIGFNVLCVITDNNGINRKAMSHFVSPPNLQYVYPHPCDKSRPLFFIVDSVHLLKCIRNNWLNQKNSEKCFYYPDFDEEFNLDDPHNFKTASLATVRLLYDKEFNSLIKFGFKLTHKALFPSNVERQNVSLVLNVFNDFVAQALIELGDENSFPYFHDTADFIKIILKWWQIMNVKYPLKGSRMNNSYETPLTYDESDDKLIFLHQFADWLDEWEKMGCTTGMFSRETHAALKLTVLGIIQITKYCKDELNIPYILPGKFQTDDLESRFSLYRNLAGSQFYISLQQLFECEKKLRIQSVLELKIPTKEFGDIEIRNFEVDYSMTNNDIPEYQNASNISVESADLDDAISYIPVFIYIAGYCIHAVLKRDHCESCVELHLCDKNLNLNVNYDFLKNLDRGKLKFPKEHIVNAILYNYVVVNKLCSDLKSDFLKLKDHRKIVYSTTISILEDHDMLPEETCENGHSISNVLKKVLWASSNIFLNNFCKKCNDDLAKSRFKKNCLNKDKKKSEAEKGNCINKRKLDKFTPLS